jgi:SAM-dependent methyltransferase
LSLVEPDGLILDFGCGTGRAARKMADEGHDVLLIDFADNCRDQEAANLPFLEWDLTKPCPARGVAGFCTDVMEHIPDADVALVIDNIMEAGRKVYFQINTVPDSFGAMLGTTLHLSVHDHAWWHDLFLELGYIIRWQEQGPISSKFLVTGE